MVERDLRIHARAKGGTAFFAVSATSIGHIEGHNDSIAFFEKGDAGAGLDYYSHVLMTFMDVSCRSCVIAKFGFKTYQSTTPLSQLFCLDTCAGPTRR
jgi:hypothetical protein